LQLILECRSTSSPMAYKFCMAAMTWVLRHSLHTREDAKAHVHACRDRFLESLMESFKLCKAKTEQARIRLLVDMHGDKLYLVFPKLDIDTAVAHLHDPAAAHVHMGRLVASSELGRAMFSEMVQSSLSSKCSAAIAAEVKKVKGKAVTKEVWDTHCRAAVAAAGAIDTHKLLRPRRVAILQYRGVQVHVKVKSFLEEAECLLSGMCKEVAVKSLQLVPLVFEKDFVPDDSFEYFPASVGDDLLHAPRLARQTLNAVLQAYDCSAGMQSVSALVRKQQEKCCKDDPCFLIELSFLGGMDGEQGVAIAKSRLLEHLPTQPSADPGFAVSSIAAHVSSLAGSPLASFISVDMRGHLDTCSNIVQAISAKRPPFFPRGSLQRLSSCL
jgi:hypothetical protein